MTPNPQQAQSLASILGQQQGDVYGQSDSQASSGITDQLKGIMSAAVNVASATQGNTEMSELMRQIRQLAMRATMLAQGSGEGSESAPQGMASGAY